MADSVYSKILNEARQTDATRAHLYKPIEKELGRPVVCFFTSFSYPTSIHDSDADILQDILQRMDLSKGLALIISSPGGDGLAAERIVNLCRGYSGTGEFWAVVPGKAKSAGSIITMGASKIFMAPSSELGPVDPQIIRRENGSIRQWSAYNLVTSYDKLFNGAARSKGNLEPYLQQLSKYDARDIQTYRQLISLAEDISVKLLCTGMMQGKTKSQIKKKVEVFLNPEAGTKTHGRPIYRDEARNCGLNVEDVNIKSTSWEKLYELYMRLDQYVSTQASKAVEGAAGSFYAPPPENSGG